MRKPLKIIHVVGTRPNFVKIASVLGACKKVDGIESVLVHTGQHYSDNMSDNFFNDLGIPLPDVNLEVGSGSHAQQTGEIMKRFEPVLLEHKPDAVLVVGDVNSTVACAMVATKLGIKTVHVEAGLRSFDRTMPEEINRILTDAISDVLFVTEPSGVANLKNEGIDEHKIHFVGNVMIDTLELHKKTADKSNILVRLNLLPKEFCVVTLHRPSNVDECQALRRILDALVKIQNEIKVVFPVHPRTLKQFESTGLLTGQGNFPNIMLIEPLGYLDFMKLMSESRMVITDSGGIQEETTVLGIPCLTVRENTERPITITGGTNMLVGTDTDKIILGFRESLSRKKHYSRPHLWDGKASERIVQVLLNVL
jgi:UDP-N-acetylglucosamine 2-epimerase (non-hydrolysing)